MKGMRPHGQPVVRSLGEAAGKPGGRLTDRSLVLYLITVAAGQAWILLNTDVQDLLRRVH